MAFANESGARTSGTSGFPSFVFNVKIDTRPEESRKLDADDTSLAYVDD